MALILCLPLIIQGLSGSILVLRKQIAPQSNSSATSVYQDATSQSKKISEEKNPRKEFVRFFKKLHTNLFINNEKGRAIIGIYGFAMLFLSISGLILWWPKKENLKRALTFKFSSTGKKFHRDLHASVGFWSMIFLLISSISGIYLIYFGANKIIHSLHEGTIIGLSGQIIVFIIGFLPLLFSITGIVMWLSKR